MGGDSSPPAFLVQSSIFSIEYSSINALSFLLKLILASRALVFGYTLTVMGVGLLMHKFDALSIRFALENAF